MNDTYRCLECEALIQQEWDLCEDCHSRWVNYQKHMDIVRQILAATDLDPLDSYWETV